MTSAAASQLVDKLVLAGLVVRTEGAVDRRRRTVGLTERGRDLIAKGFEMWSDWVPELLESLGAEGRRKTSELLPSLVAAEKSLPRRPSISDDARCNKRVAVSS